jgi:type II secretory pathway component PulK
MDTPATPTKTKRRRQEGVALVAVLCALAILGVAVGEFSTDTTIDVQAAANARDDMQTEFLVRSGANLGQLIIRLQTDLVDRYRQQLGDFQVADYAGMFMGAFGGTREEVDAFAQSLGGFRADAIKGLGVAVGSFDVQITTDDGKINMNCANGSQETQDTLKAQIDALFFFEGFDPIFEKPDAEGWQRDRATQTQALIDYIDRGNAQYGSQGAMEEYGYESLDDRYKPKNNYLDTVDELKLVRGVDDRFWTLFGDQFTIYGDCKVNLGSVNDPKVVAAILFLAAKDPEDPVVRDPIKLWNLARAVIDARNMGSAFGGGGSFFSDLKSFSDFVKNPMTAVTDLFAAADPGTGQSTTPPATLGGQAQVEGLELDQKKLGQVARSGPRRVYRVEVVATVPRGAEGSGLEYNKRLTAVWDTKNQNQNMRDQAYNKGAWVYWREE